MGSSGILKWIYFYSKTSNDEPLNWEISITQFCSAKVYHDFGRRKLSNFPSDSEDFASVFTFLISHPGNVIEKLSDDKQRTFTNFLTRTDQFQQKHHISLSKCFMKAYICELAPIDRIQFVASSSIRCEEPTCLSPSNVVPTFNNIQSSLKQWLLNNACKGLERLHMKLNQSYSRSEWMVYTQDHCHLASQLLYAVKYCAESRIGDCDVKVPSVQDIRVGQSLSLVDRQHNADQVRACFQELCPDPVDHLPAGDADPLQQHCADVATVCSALVQALFFHWSTGVCFQRLADVLKTPPSSSIAASPQTLSQFFSRHDKSETAADLNHTSANNGSQSGDRGFFLNLSKDTDQVKVNKLFGKVMAEEPTNGECSNKPSSNGDSSPPDIFLTPTEELTVGFSQLPVVATKLLPGKTTAQATPCMAPANGGGPPEPSPAAISLKAEYQRKKQTQPPPPQKSHSVVETTWLDQRDKSQPTSIHSTPTKTARSGRRPSQPLPQQPANQQHLLLMEMRMKRNKIQEQQHKQDSKRSAQIGDQKKQVFFTLAAASTGSSSSSRRASTTSAKSSTASTPLQQEAPTAIPALSDPDQQNSPVASNSKIPAANQTMQNLKLTNHTHESAVAVNDLANGCVHHQATDGHSANQDVPDVTQATVNNLPCNPANQIVSVSTQKTSNVVTSVPINHGVNDIEDEQDCRHADDFQQLENPESLQDYEVALTPASPRIDPVPPTFTGPIRTNTEPSIALSTNKSERDGNNNMIATKPRSRASTPSSLSDSEEDVVELPNTAKTALSTVSQLHQELMQISQTLSARLEGTAGLTPTNPSSLTEVTAADDEMATTPDSVEMEPPQQQVAGHTGESSSASIGTWANLPVVFPGPPKGERRGPEHRHSPSETGLEGVKFNSRLEQQPQQHLDQEQHVEEEPDVEDPMTDSIVRTESLLASSSEDDLASSLDLAASVEAASISPSPPVTQPIAFVIDDNEMDMEEAQRRTAEKLARRDQKRLKRLEQIRLKREVEKERQLSLNAELELQREEKKRADKEKRDSLLLKYLETKEDNESRGFSSMPPRSGTQSSAAGVKVRPPPASNSARMRRLQASSINLGPCSPQRNPGYSSMRIKTDNRSASVSTPRLNIVPGPQSPGNSSQSHSNGPGTFGVPLPAQEYTGPKLFKMPQLKSNRSVIINAISYCCLAGSVNEPVKEAVLKRLADTEGTHFVVLFRDARCQYRALYNFSLAAETLSLVVGSGPRTITHEMVEKFYKYNSGAKQFKLILSTKHLSPAIDGVVIQSHLWSRSCIGNNTLSGAVSTQSIPNSSMTVASRTKSGTRG